jgi:outer membrane protein assembly factor BamB
MSWGISLKNVAHFLKLFVICTILFACSQSEIPSSKISEPTALTLVFTELAHQVTFIQGELRPTENIIAKNGFQQPVAVRLDSTIPATNSSRAAPSLELRDLYPGHYTLFVEGFDVAGGVALYEGVQKLEVKPNVRTNTVAKGASTENPTTIQSVRLQRALGTLRVLTTLAPEENLSYVARVAAFTAPMKLMDKGLTGVLSSMPTGRDQMVLLEARDAAGNLRFQAHQHVTIQNSEQSVTLGWQAVRTDTAAPNVVVLEANPESDQNKLYRLSVRADSLGISMVEQVEIHWGDGTSQTVAVGAVGGILNLEHVYDTTGAQVITITALSRSGTAAQAVQLVQVNGLNPTQVETRSLVTLEVGNVPLNASAVYARFTPEAISGGGRNAPANLEPRLVLLAKTASPRIWSVTTHLERDRVWTLELSADLPASGGSSRIASKSAAQKFQPSKPVDRLTASFLYRRTPQPGEAVRLQLTPQHALFTEAGQHSEFAVEAWSSSGEALDLDAGDLEWVVSDPAFAQLKPKFNTADITSQTALGQAYLVARLRSNPDVTTLPAMLFGATLRGTVQTYHDKDLLWPPADLNARVLKSKDDLPEIDWQSNTASVQGVALDRLMAAPDNQDFKIIVQNQPLEIGQTLLPLEGAAYAGKITAIEPLNNHSALLVTLRGNLSMKDAFARARYSFDPRKLEAQGLLRGATTRAETTVSCTDDEVARLASGSNVTSGTSNLARSLHSLWQNTRIDPRVSAATTVEVNGDAPMMLDWQVGLRDARFATDIRELSLGRQHQGSASCGVDLHGELASGLSTPGFLGFVPQANFQTSRAALQMQVQSSREDNVQLTSKLDLSHLDANWHWHWDGQALTNSTTTNRVVWQTPNINLESTETPSDTLRLTARRSDAKVGMRVNGHLTVNSQPWQDALLQDRSRLCAALGNTTAPSSCLGAMSASPVQPALQIQLGPDIQLTNAGLSDVLMNSSGSERSVQPLVAQAEVGTGLEAGLRGLVDNPALAAAAWGQTTATPIDVLPKVVLNRPYTLDQTKTRLRLRYSNGKSDSATSDLELDANAASPLNALAPGDQVEISTSVSKASNWLETSSNDGVTAAGFRDALPSGYDPDLTSTELWVLPAVSGTDVGVAMRLSSQVAVSDSVNPGQYQITHGAIISREICQRLTDYQGVGRLMLVAHNKLFGNQAMPSVLGYVNFSCAPVVAVGVKPSVSDTTLQTRALSVAGQASNEIKPGFCLAGGARALGQRFTANGTAQQLSLRVVDNKQKSLFQASARSGTGLRAALETSAQLDLAPGTYQVQAVTDPGFATAQISAKPLATVGADTPRLEVALPTTDTDLSPTRPITSASGNGLTLEFAQSHSSLSGSILSGFRRTYQQRFNLKGGAAARLEYRLPLFAKLEGISTTNANCQVNAAGYGVCTVKPGAADRVVTVDVRSSLNSDALSRFAPASDSGTRNYPLTVLDDPLLCSDVSAPTPLGASLPGHTAAVLGDPHAVSFDRVAFDSHALGEFVYMQPRTGQNGVSIQARHQTALGRPSNDGSTVVTAIAVQLEAHRFEYRVRPRPIALLDGEAIDLDSGVYRELGAGTALSAQDGFVTLFFPDGALRLRPSFGALSLWLTLEDTANDRYAGLLGRSNGDPSDDLQLPDGSAAPKGFGELALSEGWRVHQTAASLFTYAPGESPQTFALSNQVFKRRPTPEQLLPFREQASSLLSSTCNVPTGVVPRAGQLDAIAFDLYYGLKPEQVMVLTCNYLVTGFVSNQNNPGKPVVGVRVNISSNELGSCKTHTDSTGRYRCVLTPKPGASLPKVRIDVDGKLVLASFLEKATPGSTATLNQDIDATPTTLIVSGQALDPSGQAVREAKISIKTDTSSLSAVTDETGHYEVTTTFSRLQAERDIFLEIAADAPRLKVTRRVGVRLLANAVKRVTHDLRLTRAVTFSGRLLNALINNVPLEGTLVVRRTGANELCRASTRGLRLQAGLDGALTLDDLSHLSPAQVIDLARRPSPGSNELPGAFKCSAELDTNDAFAVSLEAIGPWGTQVFAAKVAAIPTQTSVADELHADVLVKPTTVRFVGRTSTKDGSSLNAQVSAAFASATAFGPGLFTQTEAGRYELLTSVAEGARGEVTLSAKTNDFAAATSQTLPTLIPNTINTVETNLNLEYHRSVTFKGQLISSLGSPPNTLVRVVREGGAELCRVQTFGAEYQCNATLFEPGAFRVSYLASGDWGTLAPVTEDVTADALTVTHDLNVNLTAVRLRGKIINRSGAAVDGALLELLSGQGLLIPETAQLSVTGDRFEFRGLLREGVRSGRLELSASVKESAPAPGKPEGLAVGSAGVSFTNLEPGQLHDFGFDINLDSGRMIRFIGRVNNTLVPNLPLRAEVVVNDNDGGEVCRTSTDAQGRYQCSVLARGLAGFAVTHRLQGDWGTKVFVEPMTVADGAIVTVERDLSAAPTTVMVTGRLIDSAERPITDGLVSLYGDTGGLSTASSLETTPNAAGVYQLPLVFKAGQTSARATLGLRAGAGSASAPVDVRGVLGTLSTVQIDLSVGRAMLIEGILKNRFVPGQTLPGEIQARTADGQPLCRATAANDGHFRCEGFVSTEAAVPVMLEARGSWGEASLSGTIPTGNLVSASVYKRDLEVDATTLHFTGRLLDATGQPPFQGRVRISGPEIGQTEVMTDSLGLYHAYLVAPANRARVTVNWQTRDDANNIGNNMASQALAVDVHANAITDVNHDFTLENREPGTARWAALGTVGFVAPPALGVDGSLYLSGRDGQLYALNPNGTLRWKDLIRADQTGLFAQTNAYAAAPALAEDGTVYATTARTLKAYAADGTARWTLTTADAVNPVGPNRIFRKDPPPASAVAVGSDGTVYTGGDKLYAVAPNGAIRWSLKLDEWNTHTNAIAVAPDGTIYVSVADLVCPYEDLEICKFDQDSLLEINYLAAINSDGSRRWKREGLAMTAMVADSSSNVNGWRYNVKIGSNDQVMSIAGDATIRWTQPVSSGALVRGMAVDDDDELVLPWVNPSTNTAGPAGQGVGRLRRDGSLRWFAPLETQVTAVALGEDALIYASATNRRVSAIKPDRSLSWNFETPSILSSLTLAEDGTVYAVGSITTAINSRAGRAKPTIWALPGQTSRHSSALSPDNTPRRIVHFEGQVVNRNAPLEALTNAQIVVRRLGGHVLCEAASDANGHFLCGATVADLNAFGIQVETQTQYGAFTLEASVPGGVAAETSVVDPNLRLPITTLRVAGTVRDSSGKPVPGAYVTLKRTDNATEAPISLTASSAGEFEKLLFLPTNTSDITLEVTAAKGAASLPQRSTINLNNGGFNEKVFDFSLDPNAIGSLAWNYATGGNIVSALALSTDGTVYAASFDGKLHAIQNGLARWTYDAGQPLEFSPVVLGNGTVLLAAGRSLRAIGLDGHLLWRVDTVSDAALAPVADADTIYFATRTQLNAYTLTGQPRWSQALPDPGKRAMAIGRNGSVYLAMSTRLRAYHPDGALYWDVPLSVHGLAISSDDMLYTSGTNTVYALAPHGGILWQKQLEKAGEPVILSDGNVLFGRNVATSLEPMALYSPQGSLLAQLANGDAQTISSDGMLYSSDASHLRAVTLEGQDRWQANAVGAFAGAPLILPDHKVVAATRDGHVLAIHAISSALATSAWSRVGRDQSNLRQAHRRVVVKGIARNEFIPSRGLSNLELTVETATGTPLCRVVSADDGSFVCAFNTTTSGETALVVRSVTASTSLTLAAGDLGSSLELNVVHDVPETTLELVGVVRNRVDRPVEGALVRLTDPLHGETYTDANGRYSLRIPVSSANSYSLSVFAAKGVARFDQVLPVTVSPNRLSSATLDFKFGTNQFGQMAWVVPGGSPGITVGAGNLLYTGGKVLDADGTEHGSASSSARVTIGAAGGVVTVSGNQVAVSNADGSSLWKTSAPDAGSLNAVALGQNGEVYATGGRNLYAFDGAGLLLWTWQADHDLLSAPVVGADGTIYLGSPNRVPSTDSPTPSGGMYYAINPDGHLKWLTPLNAAFHSAAIGANGTLYVPSGDGELVALEPNEGTVLWRSRIGDTASGAPTITTDGTILIPARRAGSSDLVALRPDGSLRWTYSTSGAISPATVAADGRIYSVVSNLCTPERLIPTYYPATQYDYACDAGALVALDLEGHEQWRFAADPALSLLGGHLKLGAPPTVLDDGLVLAVLPKNSNDQLSSFAATYAINTASPGLAVSAWSVIGHDAASSSRTTGIPGVRRFIAVKGLALNQFGPGEAVENAAVEVRTSSGAFVCRTRTDSTGYYLCGTQTQTLDALGLRVTLGAPYTSVSVDTTMPAGLATLSYENRVDLRLPVTTLKVSGLVHNITNQLVIGGEVSLSSPNFGTQTLITDANGRFERFFTVPQGINALTIELRYRDADGTALTRETINLAPQALTERVLDLNASASTPGLLKFSQNAGISSNTALALDTSGQLYAVRGQQLVAFDLEGRERWAITVGTDALTPVITHDGTIIVGSSSDTRAFNPDGSPRWTAGTKLSLGLAVASDDRLYGISSDHSALIALEANGQTRWTTPLTSLASSAPVITSTGLIAFGTDDHLEVRKVDGTLERNLAAPGARWLALNSRDELLSDSTDGRLRAFATDGTLRWQYALADANTPILVGANDTLYVGTADPSSSARRLIALDVNGSLLWTQTTGGTAVPSAIGADGTVYLTSSDRQLVALKPDGTPTWHLSFSSAPSSALMTPTGDLVFATNDGKLNVVATSSSGAASSAWSQLNHDPSNARRAGTAIPVALSRIVRVRGAVLNQNRSTQALPEAVVTILRLDGSELCRATTNSQGVYACGGPINQFTTGELKLGVSSVYGNTSRNTAFDAGLVGSSLEVTQDLLVPATTVVLSGIVRTPDAAVVSSGTVTLQGGISGVSSINSAGRYEFAVMLPSTITGNLSITLNAQSGAFSSRRVINLSVVEGQLNDRLENLVLEQRNLGQERWSFATGGAIHAAPAIANDGTIYLTSEDSKLYALDANHTERWNYTTLGPILTSPVIHPDGFVLVASSDHTVYAVNLGGSLRWSHTSPSAASVTPSIGQDGNIYLQRADGVLEVLSNAGEPRWTRAVGTPSGAAPIVGPDGTVYLANNAGTTLALNPEGSQRWLDHGSSAVLDLALNAGGELFALETSGTLRHYARDGQLLERNVAGGLSNLGNITVTSSNQATSSLGRINLLGDLASYRAEPGTTGTLSEINANGLPNWSYQQPALEPRSLALGHDGVVYVGIGARLVAVNAVAQGLATGAWSKVARDASNTGRMELDSNALNLKTLNFSGVVRNNNASGAAIVGQEVSVLETDNTLLCRAFSDSDGHYACSARTLKTGNLALRLHVGGVYGQTTIAASLPVAVTGSSSLERDLSLNVTTVVVHGQVKLDAASVAANATVYVGNAAPITTDATGQYSATLIYPTNQTNLTLELRATQGSEAVTVSLPLTLLPSQRLDVQRNLIFHAPGALRWSQDLGATPSGLALESNSLTLARGDRILQLSTDGLTQWAHVVPGATLNTPAISPTQILTTASQVGASTLRALEPATGILRWSYTSNPAADILSTPALLENDALFTTNDGRLIRVSAEGQLVWTASLPTPVVTTPIVGADGTIFIATDRLTAINPNGSPRWSIALTGQAVSAAALPDGGLLVTRNLGSSGLLENFDANGTLRWQRSLVSPPRFDLAIGANGRIYLNTDIALMAFAADSNPLWSAPGNPGSIALGQSGTVYVGGSTIRAVNPDGQPLWSYNSLTLGTSALTLGEGGSLYAALTTIGGGSLIALGTDADSPANGPWDRNGRDNHNSSAQTRGTTPQRLTTINGTLTDAALHQALAGYNLRLDRPDGTLFCQTTTDTLGAFRCGAPATLEAQNLNWTATGEYGDANGTLAVSAGTTDLGVVANLDVPVTSLNVSGTILRETLPVANAIVSVTGDINQSMTTSSDGKYSFAFRFKRGVAIAHFDLLAHDTTTASSAHLDVTLLATQVNTINRNLEFQNPGSLLWNFDPREASGETRLVRSDDDSLYTSSQGSRLHSVGGEGRLVWSIGAIAERRSNVVVAADATLLSVVGRGTNAALEANDAPLGHTSWSLPLDGGFGQPTLTQDGSILVLDEAGGATLATRGGALLWRVPNVAPNPSGIPATITADGTILVAHSDVNLGAQLTALNNDGSKRWTAQVGTSSTTVRGLALGTGQIYVTTSDNTLHVLDLEGTALWQHTDIVGTPIVATDGVIAATGSGVVRLTLDGATTTWTRALNSAPTTAPLLGDDGMTYIGDSTGHVYGIRADGSIAWTLSTPNTEHVTDLNIAHNQTINAAFDSRRVANIKVLSGKLAEAPWATANRDSAGRRVQPSDNLPRRLVRLAGRVTLNTLPVANYTVTAKLGAALLCRTTTDATGRYTCTGQTNTLTAITLNLQAQGRSDNITRQASANLELPAGTDTLTQSLDLAVPFTGVHLFGVARHTDGTTGTDVRVEASAVTDGIKVNASVLTDTNGNYSFILPLSDTPTTLNINLRSSLEGGAALTQRNVSINTQTATTLERNQDLTPTSLQLSGTVRQADGSSVAEAEVRASGAVTGITTTDANGHYQFAFAVLGNTQTITVQMQASKDGQTLIRNIQQAIALDTLNSRTVDFNFGSPTVLHLLGTVSRTNGSLAANASVQINASANSTSRSVTVNTDATGHYEASMFFSDNPTLAYYSITVTDAFHTASNNGNQTLTVRETTDKMVDFSIDNTTLGQVTDGLPGVKDLMYASDRTYTTTATEVIATSSTGTTLWRKPFSLQSEMSLGANDSILAIETSNALVKISKDGDVVWRVVLDDTACTTCSRAPAIATDGTVYVAPSSKLIGIKDGLPKLSVSLTGTAVSEPIVDASGNIYVKQSVVGLERVTSFDVAGVERWHKDATTYGVATAPPILTTDGRIVLGLGGSLDSYLLDGTMIWTRPGYGVSALVTDTSGAVIYMPAGGSLTKVTSNGTLVWTAYVGYGVSELILGNDGIVYGPSEYGIVRAINATSGNEFVAPSEHGNLGQVQKLLGLSSNKRLVLQNANGISFVNVNSSGLADSWARRGRDQTRAGQNPATIPTHRWVTLSGALKNMTLPDKLLTSYYVRALVNGVSQCDAAVVQVASNVNYSCRIETTSTDAFTATIEARDNYSATVPALTLTQSVSTAALSTVTNIAQDLELHPTMMRLTGTIRDAAGLPVANRYSTLYVSGWNSYGFTTDAQGQYSVVDFVDSGSHTPTLYSTDANNNSYSKTFAAFVPIANTLTEQTLDLQFDADGELTVSGVLRDHLNNVVANTSVNVYFSGTSNQSSSVATDANGQYTFSRHVKPGAYTITVGSYDRASRYKTASLSNISVVASATVSQTLDLKFDPVGEVIVKGTVKIADGTPANSRFVSIEGLPYQGYHYVYSLADGTYEYHQWIAINNYNVYATTNDPYGFAVKSQTLTVTADPNAPTTVNLELQDPQTAALVVNGQVSDSGGFAYINKYVSLEVKSGAQVYTQGAYTDSSGSFAVTFRTLEGTHSLKVSVDDPNGVSNTTQINDIVLSATTPVTKTVNISLAQTGSLALQGQVLNTDGSPYLGSYYYYPLAITLSSTNFNKTFSVFSDAQGQYVLNVTVPIGVYSIELTPTGNATKQVVTLQNTTISVGTTTSQTLNLSFRSVTVTGVVRDEIGQPVSGAYVYGSSTTGSCSSCYMTTNADGVYTFKYEVGMDTIRFDGTINASKSLDYNLYTQVNSSVAQDLTTGNVVISQDITLPTKVKTLKVSGTVLDAQGNVAAGINVSSGNSTGMSCSVCYVVSDAQGHYQLEFGALSSTTSVQFSPYIYNNFGGFIQSFTFPINLTSDTQTQTQDLQLTASPVQLEITGKVLLQGVAQTGVAVSFNDLGGGVCTVCTATTDATGLYRLQLTLPIGTSYVTYGLKAGASNQLFNWSESLDWSAPNAVVHDLELTP